MIKEFFRKLVTRAKEVARVLKAQCNALISKLLPTAPVKIFLVPGISPALGNAMKMGKRYRNGQKRISLPIHISRKTQVPALNRALADILSMNSRNDAAGDLSGGCQKTVQTPVSGVYLSPKKV